LHAIAELELSHPAAAAQREYLLFRHLGQDLQDGLGLVGALDDLGRAPGLHGALQLERERGERRRLHVEGVEGQGGRAAELEAAASQQQGCGEKDEG
jgi:hypothetical protein